MKTKQISAGTTQVRPTSLQPLFETNPRLNRIIRLMEEKYGLYTERVLGEGGHGAALLMRDSTRKKLVAKIVQKPLVAGESGQRGIDLQQEVYALAGLDHPGIPKHIGCANLIEEGVLISVREYVDGRSLREIIGTGRINEQMAVMIMQSMLEILHYIHDPSQHQKIPHPIFHRDINPKNIIITGNGTVHLIDFGAAKLDGLTATMTMKGTLDYVPYEQTYTNNPSNDLYALGVTIIEALTGTIPDSLKRKQGCVIAENLGITRGLKTVLERMVATDETQRYTSATRVIRAMRKDNDAEQGLTVMRQDNQTMQLVRQGRYREAMGKTITRTGWLDREMACKETAEMIVSDMQETVELKRRKIKWLTFLEPVQNFLMSKKVGVITTCAGAIGMFGGLFASAFSDVLGGAIILAGSGIAFCRYPIVGIMELMKPLITAGVSDGVIGTGIASALLGIANAVGAVGGGWLGGILGGPIGAKIGVFLGLGIGSSGFIWLSDRRKRNMITRFNKEIDNRLNEVKGTLRLLETTRPDRIEMPEDLSEPIRKIRGLLPEKTE